ALAGFSSDYNVLYRTSPGALWRWNQTEFSSRADWYYEFGMDAHSQVADPLFVDADGADNVLGYLRSGAGQDGGVDDNFAVQANSPTLDAGDPLSYYLGEPRFNGGRVNVGHLGNTSAALP